MALAESETIPAGSFIEFTIMTFDDGLWPTIDEWLQYGMYRGIGQWRNSGKGRFSYEYID